MLYTIADLKTIVPAAGGMLPRCAAYLAQDGSGSDADIVIDEALYRCERWPGLSYESAVYMESAGQFYHRLPDFGGLMLHASATVIDGEAYLFAGQSGIGKSTHAGLLQKLFPGALPINDDKPALRRIDGRWMAYGTPWCGKDGINTNAKYPLKAICFLTERRDRNDIRPADPLTAAARILSCTTRRLEPETMNRLLTLTDHLIREISVYEMDSLADDAAALLAYRTMKGELSP